jgi:hypothetical protein
LWKALGKAAVLHDHIERLPIVLLTTDPPQKGSAGYNAITGMIGESRLIYDLIELLDSDGQTRLRTYAQGLAPR